jgi:hypothetical protein
VVAYRDVAVNVRTTTAEPKGRAGLAYPAVPVWQAMAGPAYICGLRQNATDRSNVAVQNAGAATDGDIPLRLTVYSGDPAAPFSKPLPDVKLTPGGFKQFDSVLFSSGIALANGYVRVERVSGTAPYYAYAVINDQANSDGSFIPPLPANANDQGVFLTLPVVLETGSFSSEVALANLSTAHKTLRFSYVADPIQTPNRTANFTIELGPGEQSILPNFVQYLRDRGIQGVGGAGSAYVGPLTAKLETGDSREIFLGARTSTPGDGGRYGVFYVAVPFFPSFNSAWLYGLEQNSENRSNLAIVNTGETVPSVFDIDIFDGETGTKVKTVEGFTVSVQGWRQIDAILAQYAPGTRQGYARVRRTSDFNFFIAYTVINDGAQPGERTGDGAFISSSP